MRELDENAYAKLVQGKKVVSVGRAPEQKPEAPLKASMVSSIRDAIVGIRDGVMKLLTFEKSAQDRNDILNKMASAMASGTAKEWTFEIERNKDGYIERIKATRR